MLWDNLPDCLLDKIYKYIYLTQPKDLLNDIKSYKYTVDYIDNINNYYGEWNTLWYIMLFIEKNENFNLNNLNIKYFELKKYIINNNNLIIRYQGGLYWIKKYIIKMSICERMQLIKCLNEISLS